MQDCADTCVKSTGGNSWELFPWSTKEKCPNCTAAIAATELTATIVLISHSRGLEIILLVPAMRKMDTAAFKPKCKNYLCDGIQLLVII